MATYKFRVAANGGDIRVGSLSIAISNNTDTPALTGTLYLTQQGGTILGTDSMATGSDTLVFPALSGTVNITNGTYADFVLEFHVSDWYHSGNPGSIDIEVANIDYFDVFSDASTALHPSMFTNYKWDIAPVSTLVTLE